MPTNIGLVSLRGIYHDDSTISWNLASTITTADIGKAVTLDTGAANTVKLAGDNDRILGRLESVESRAQEGTAAYIGTVAMRGSFAFPVNPNATASSPDETPAVGDYITGGTATGSLKGYVNKSYTSTEQKDWLVVETYTGYVVAIKV